MTYIKALETFVDGCTDIFIEAMHDLESQAVDLGVWLQLVFPTSFQMGLKTNIKIRWYVFDIIGGITFQRRFGFLEKRQDIEGMIGGI
jgi:hypothetical protein